MPEKEPEAHRLTFDRLVTTGNLSEPIGAKFYMMGIPED
jgi:hypothetical protein